MPLPNTRTFFWAEAIAGRSVFSVRIKTTDYRHEGLAVTDFYIEVVFAADRRVCRIFTE